MPQAESWDVNPDVAVLSLECVGLAGKLETQAGFPSYGLEAEFLLLWETTDFTLKAFD